jgi:hypothetical protein
MTSQIAISNHAGVAVASDTVTTAYVEGGTKSIGNSKKIFELGPEHKVVILHSGAVSVNGLMYKLFINEWSKTLTRPFAHLSDYMDSYIRWMSSNGQIQSKNSEISRANYLLNDHFIEIDRRTTRSINALIGQEVSEYDPTEILLGHVQSGHEYLQELELMGGLTGDGNFTVLLAEEDIDLDGKIDYYFEEYGVSDEVRKALHKSAPLVLSRAQYFSGDSVIAFVGFGEDDIFPSNIRLHSRGSYGGKYLYFIGSKGEVGPESSSLISAFAQDDAIFGFVRGFRRELMDHVYSQVETMVNERIENDEGENVGAEIVEKLRDEVFSYYRRRFTDPILDSIEGLTINHLADLAESLVGMEATAAFGGDGPATVGGMIEVATIDRINGVRWVKAVSS